MKSSLLVYSCGVAVVVGTGAVASVFGVKHHTVTKYRSDGLVAQPQFDYTNEYGDPYNITVTCTHRGWPANLDPSGKPAAGQTLVRKCVVTRLGPSG